MASGTRKTILFALLLLAALSGYRLATPSSTPTDDLHEESPSVPTAPRGPLDDGVVPSGTTVFDGAVPAVQRLDPALLAALRRAATAAKADGRTLVVESGWRSPEHQQRLLEEAVATYGSAREAARWVATPATSAHVTGDAVDLGPARSRAWLAEHGAAYGLCRVYANEPWHYELRPAAAREGCPPLYADATRDPRMRRDGTGTVRPPPVYPT